jgi:hypothetical protein
MIVRTVALRCDSCGRLSTLSQGFDTTELARAAARREGWISQRQVAVDIASRRRPTQYDTRDVCSRCKPKT